jgi:two-component sensor histidine kinase
MFQESRGRVKSMAMIHERLYRSRDMARVDFADYLRQLVADLYSTYNVCDDEVRLEVDVEVPPLPIDVAIPCGLLLNELISNCFKHAFTAARGGRIRVSFRRSGAADNVLVVSDDGVGFPTGLDFRRTGSFGLQLVNTLAEQLGGDIDLATDRGTTFTVRFPGATG